MSLRCLLVGHCWALAVHLEWPYCLRDCRWCGKRVLDIEQQPQQDDE